MPKILPNRSWVKAFSFILTKAGERNLHRVTNGLKKRTCELSGGAMADSNSSQKKRSLVKQNTEKIKQYIPVVTSVKEITSNKQAKT